MRLFKAASVALVVSLALAACAGSPDSSKAAPAVDVVVVGSGASGSAAAYAAVAQGATVLMIEKNDKLGGTSLVSSGTFCAAGTPEQKGKGIVDSADQHIADINRLGYGKADQALLKMFVDKAPAAWRWFVDHGLEPRKDAPYIDNSHSPYSVARTMSPAKPSANEYVRILMGELDKKFAGKLTTLTSTKVVALVKVKGKIIGVKAIGPEGEKTYKAKAVILATGGYGSNQAMIAKYSPKYAAYRRVTPAWATGEGIEMAAEAGAALVNMDYIDGYFGGIPRAADDYDVGFGELTSGFADRWKGEIWVDSFGKRFTDEDDGDEDPREVALQGVKDGKVLIVFDQGMIDANGGKTPIRDFDERLAKGSFAVKRADSIEELAAAFGIDPKGLKATVDAVSAASKIGQADEFGKTTGLAFGKGPYFGVLSYPTIFLTFGGIKVDTQGRAVDSTGNPVPGLYAAGEATGSAQWGGHGMPGGIGIASALVSGDVAGAQAAMFSRR